MSRFTDRETRELRLLLSRVVGSRGEVASEVLAVANAAERMANTVSVHDHRSTKLTDAIERLLAAEDRPVDDDDGRDPPIDDGDDGGDGGSGGGTRAFNPRAWAERFRSADRSRFELVEPHGGGQWCEALGGDELIELDSRRLRCGYGCGYIGGRFQEPPLRVNITSHEFTRSPSYSKTLWGARLYEIEDSLFAHCWGHDFGDRSEHLFYLNPRGSFDVEHVLAERIGGQLLQCANREEPGSNRDIPDRGENSPVNGGQINVRRFAAIDCGMNEGRGSFPLSFKNVGRPGRVFDILVEDGLIQGRFAPQLRSGRMISSTGGILVNGFGKSEWHNGEVVIRGVEIDLTRTSHPALQISNCRSVLIEHCRIVCQDGVYPDVLFDRDDLPGYDGAKPSGSIRLRDCEGNVGVRYRGQHVGTVEDDLELGEGA